MPKIEQNQEEESKEAITDKGTMISENDEAVKKTAENIYNKLISVENEEVEDESIYQPIIVEDGEGKMPFVSNGDTKVVNVYPSNPDTEYSIEFKDEQDNVVFSTPFLKNIYRARINLIKGNYKLVIKSKFGNLPFTAKID